MVLAEDKDPLPGVRLFEAEAAIVPEMLQYALLSRLR
jgi:hypothetical protein